MNLLSYKLILSQTVPCFISLKELECLVKKVRLNKNE